jgi:D-alanyl-D-alanine carboxypeptidase
VLKPAGVGRDIGYARQPPALEGLATGYVTSWWSSGYRRAETIDADGPFAAGGLYATPRALHRWTRALHGGRVLSDSLVARMTTPHSNSGYGYGLFVEETMHGNAPTTVLHHGGGISGFTAALRSVQPAHGPAYTIVVLDNTQSDTTVETAEAVQRLLVRSPGDAGGAATG